MPVFSFSFGDFSYAFLSVLLEGMPFILVGTLLSGLIDQFLPSKTMLRLLPKNPFLGVCVSASLGLVFPMCECGVVPVIRRLIAKGLPVANAIAYMLAAPVINPIVAVSTYAAFRGQGAAEMTIFRFGLAYFVAVLVASAANNLRIEQILRPEILRSAADPFAGGGGGEACAPTTGARLRAALHVAANDFLGVMVYFVLGVAVSAAVSTGLNQKVILPLALDTWLSTVSLMGFAFVLSLCSTSDAFIAATFTAFPAAAKLAFLVFGPMLDLKLLFLYGSVFKKRFVAGLAIGLFVIIALLAVRVGSFAF